MRYRADKDIAFTLLAFTPDWVFTFKEPDFFECERRKQNYLLSGFNEPWLFPFSHFLHCGNLVNNTPVSLHDIFAVLNSCFNTIPFLFSQPKQQI